MIDSKDSNLVMITENNVKNPTNFHLTPFLGFGLFNSNLGFSMGRKNLYKNKFLKVRSI